MYEKVLLIFSWFTKLKDIIKQKKYVEAIDIELVPFIRTIKFYILIDLKVHGPH